VKIERVSKKSERRIVKWDGFDDIQNTTVFFYKHSPVGWDIPVIFAKLKDNKYGGYVIGNGHSDSSGELVNNDKFRKQIEKEIGTLEEEINNLKGLLKK